MTVIEFPRNEPRQERTTRSDTLQSVGTALDVLDCFLVTNELGVSEVARRLGIAKSSAHRLLTTLAARQIVEKNPETGQYRLGVHLFALGHLAQSRMALSSQAMPELHKLHGATGHAVFVGLLDGSDAVYPHYVGHPTVSARMLRDSRRRPAYATALGRAMSAVDEDIERRLREQAGASSNPAALVEFDQAIQRFRKSGVATSRDTIADGLCAVAAPVRRFDGKAVGGIVVAGPATRVAPSADRIARLLPASAARVSRLVGTG